MCVSRRITFGRLGFVSMLALVVLLGFSGAAQATPVTPGPGTFLPDFFTFTCPGVSCPTLLAQITTGPQFSDNLAFTFTVNAAVYSDPTNTYCANCLDFVYQVTNDPSSPDSINRVSMVNFSGAQTDVGFATNGSALGFGFTDGTQEPQAVDRVSADSVGFFFNVGTPQPIAPGTTSMVMVIETDATLYHLGLVFLQDGDQGHANAFAPGSGIAATPEPSALVLLASGFLGLILITRR